MFLFSVPLIVKGFTYMQACCVCMVIISAWLNTAEGIMLEAYCPKTDFAALIIKRELLVLFALL